MQEAGFTLIETAVPSLFDIKAFGCLLTEILEDGSSI